MTALLILLGAFAWTLAEYLLHRFDGHGMRGKTPFSRNHLRHHADPTWFAEPWKKAILAAGILGPLFGGLTLALGLAVALPFTGAFTATWLAYEWIHRRIHTHPPRGPYGRWARRHHLLHHHRSPKRNHGVTSPLWDLVFGTWDRTPVVVLSRKQAPAWLLDDAGEIRTDLAAFEGSRR